jgi:hypothetical protein
MDGEITKLQLKLHQMTECMCFRVCADRPVLPFMCGNKICVLWYPSLETYDFHCSLMCPCANSCTIRRLVNEDHRLKLPHGKEVWIAPKRKRALLRLSPRVMKFGHIDKDHLCFEEKVISYCKYKMHQQGEKWYYHLNIYIRRYKENKTWKH